MPGRWEAGRMAASQPVAARPRLLAPPWLAIGRGPRFPRFVGKNRGLGVRADQIVRSWAAIPAPGSVVNFKLIRESFLVERLVLY